MNLSTFWRIVHDVQDLDPTAKLALIMMAAYADGREGDTAALTVSQFSTALSLGDDATVRALARVVSAEWADVHNPVGKTWICTFSPRLAPRGRGAEHRVDAAVLTASARNLADRAALSLKETREKRQEGDDAAAPKGATPPPVENKSGHPDGCRCAGTGWVETTPGTAVRCVGLRAVE